MQNKSNWQHSIHGNSGYGNNQQWGNDHRDGDSWNNSKNQWNYRNPVTNHIHRGQYVGVNSGLRSGYNSSNNRGYGDDMRNQWNIHNSNISRDNGATHH